MKIIEIGTGYTTIPAKIGAATEIVIENLIRGFNGNGIINELIDVSFTEKSLSTYNAELNTIVHIQKIPRILCTIKDNSTIHILRRIIYSIKAGLFLRKYLKQQKGKIVLHFHNQFNFFFIRLLTKHVLSKYNVKTLYTIHSPGWSDYEKIPKSLLFEKFAIQKADTIISLTDIIKQKIIQLVNKIDENKIVIIPNGVSTKIYRPVETAIKKNQILNIGSICERKNQLETIKVLKPFLINKNFKFIFAGKIIDRNYHERIIQYIKNNGLDNHVRYLGELQPGEKLNELYNSCKFYISNSKQEAFTSLVILESMASGLPVLLSQSFDSLIDISSNIRSAVKIVPNKEIEKILMRFLISEMDYSNYRKSQINCITSHYEWDKLTKNINNLINSNNQ